MRTINPQQPGMKGDFWKSPCPTRCFAIRLVLHQRQIVVKTTFVNNHLKISAQLKSIRDKLDLTQAQMAGMLGINRSYLAELETERKPVQDWIIAKAKEIERRLSGLALTKRPTDDDPSFSPRGFVEFVESVAELTFDEFMELTEYLHKRAQDAPRSAALLYYIAISVVMAEFRSRLHARKSGTTKTK